VARTPGRLPGPAPSGSNQGRAGAVAPEVVQQADDIGHSDALALHRQICLSQGRRLHRCPGQISKIVEILKGKTRYAHHLNDR
jgi:hypothetical protein